MSGGKVLSLLILATSSWFACTQIRNLPIFKISKVIITGNASPRIKKSGTLKLIEGKTIFEVDIKELENFIKKDPWIKNAEVRRIPPSTIHIISSLREPICQIEVKLENKTVYPLVDREGLVITIKKKKSKIPTVMGVKLKTIKKGAKLNSAKIQKAVKGLRFLYERNRKFWKMVKEVRFSKRGVDIILKGGVKAFMGKEFSMKALVKLYIILKKIKGKLKLKYIDLRFDYGIR